MTIRSRSICALLPLLALSCADGNGPLYVDVEYNLTCPSSGGADCGSLAETCLGDFGNRTIVGAFGEVACTGDPIIATCEAVERADGSTSITLEADLGGKFAFELRGATIESGGSSIQGVACNVAITEDEVRYNIGACGAAPPSMEQPCQLSNISVEGRDIAFDLQCDSILSSTTNWAFDVGGVGGSATVRFENCTGL